MADAQRRKEVPDNSFKPAADMARADRSLSIYCMQENLPIAVGMARIG